MLSFLKFKKSFLLGLIFFAVFFIIGLVSLPNYGQNWDESTHFSRGQSFLRYFLTGKKDFSDFPEGYNKSYFQSESVNNFKFYVGPNRTAHPVASDILAALSNYIFFQKLNILGDVESYHLYGLFLSSVLVGVVVYFTSFYFGNFASIASGLSLLFYPFFLGESRFNTKDFPETFFYSMFVLSFWLAVRKRKIFLVFISSLLFGLGLATKFNIFFAGFTVLLWFSIFSLSNIRRNGFSSFVRFYKRLIFSFILIPIIGFILFYATWPLLWTDSFTKIEDVFFFYKGLSDSGLDPRFLVLGGLINIYPILWIGITTPIVILIFSILGLIKILGRIRPDSVELFLLIWFLVPILRVTVVHSFIYGGIRHIMEFIPVMAIISGVGAAYLAKYLKKLIDNSRLRMPINLRFLLYLAIILSFLPIALKVASIYPNESVYFNPFIGGLKGASEKNIPGWGNTLGSTYRQGINWINEHAEPNAKLALLFENISNVDRSKLRKDIMVRNQFRSGIGRYGEYIIGVTHEGFFKEYYNYKYTQRFLNPTYKVEIDGVTLLAVWRNDAVHTKAEYLKPEKEVGNVKIEKENNLFRINFSKKITLTKIALSYDSSDCKFPEGGVVQIYKDGSWISQTGTIGDFPKPFWFNSQPEIGLFLYPFAGDVVSSVRMVSDTPESCFMNNPVRVNAWQL